MELKPIALALICKTPETGFSKTRLSPPLSIDECAAISSCFIRDVSATIDELVDDINVTGYAIYTPKGTEEKLRPLLPPRFRLLPQADGDFGTRLLQATIDLLQLGHSGAILVNSDSPTLPEEILREAVDALREGDNVVLSRAIDGGYTLIGLNRARIEMFTDIPWSTNKVYERSLQCARRLGSHVVELAEWYDVDDAASFEILKAEIAGNRPSFANAAVKGANAPATRNFMRRKQTAIP